MAVETEPLLKDEMAAIPKAPWATAIQSNRDDNRYLPQTIAHRGYKAEWPENTMAAFKAAIGAGSHALETDVHLSADGVVVLSHDGDLKRCFGVNENVRDHTWEYLSTLRTIRAPPQPMPRLLDLLEWLAKEPQLEKWLLLDIKIDDRAEDLMKAIRKTLLDAPSPIPWEQRIVLGCWNATFLDTARRVLPEYPIAHITWSLPYARHFMSVPNLGFNLLQKSLIGPIGARFLRKAKSAGKPVFAWTVNEEKWMEWCIRKNVGRQGKEAVIIDGVITDDPKLFLEVCERWEDEADGTVKPRSTSLAGRLRSAWGTVIDVLTTNAFVAVFHVRMRYILRMWDRPQHGKPPKKVE